MEIIRNDDPLFSRAHLSDVLRAQEEKVRSAVDEYEANRLLNTPPDDLIDYFAEDAAVAPVELHREAITTDRAECTIPVERLRDSFFMRGGGGPRRVPGTKISFHVPFSGDPAIFKLQPNTWTSNPPRGEVRGQELVLSFLVREPSGPQIKEAFGAQLRSIESYLGHCTTLVLEHNKKARQIATKAVHDRRDRLLKAQQTAAAIGYPMRRRADSPGTYATPVVRRRIRPVRPPASSAPFQAEPALPTEEYEYILNVLRNMALVLEHSPAAFATMNEEDLRQHFLVHLNGAYKGSATGETFNAGGKTDILIRDEGKNLFIAECKFWKGPAKFGQAVDQLLSYTSWRDSKTAILVFSRDTALTTVLAKIPEVLKAHPNFKRMLATQEETECRAVLHHNNDPSRDLVVSVLAFDVPSPPRPS